LIKEKLFATDKISSLFFLHFQHLLFNFHREFHPAGMYSICCFTIQQLIIPHHNKSHGSENKNKEKEKNQHKLPTYFSSVWAIKNGTILISFFLFFLHNYQSIFPP